VSRDLDPRGEGGVSRVRRMVVDGMREAIGLLVDDGAVAGGIVLAVAVAALLAGQLGSSNVVGWVLFVLVWVALGISLGRARSRG
jgi:hypothetical protein